MDIKKAFTYMFKDRNFVPVLLMLFLISVFQDVYQDLREYMHSSHDPHLKIIAIIWALALLFLNIYFGGYYLSIVKNTNSVIDKVLLNPISCFSGIFRLGRNCFFAFCLLCVPVAILLFMLFLFNKFIAILLAVPICIVFLLLYPAISFNFIKTEKLTVFYRLKSAFDIIKTAPKSYFGYCILPPIVYLVLALCAFIILSILFYTVLELCGADTESLRSDLLFTAFLLPLNAIEAYMFFVFAHLHGQFYDKYVKENA